MMTPEEVVHKWFRGGTITTRIVLDDAFSVTLEGIVWRISIQRKPRWVRIQKLETLRNPSKKHPDIPDFAAFVYKEDCKYMLWSIWKDISRDDLQGQPWTFIEQWDPAWQIRKPHD